MNLQCVSVCVADKKTDKQRDNLGTELSAVTDLSAHQMCVLVCVKEHICAWLVRGERRCSRKQTVCHCFESHSFLHYYFHFVCVCLPRPQSNSDLQSRGQRQLDDKSKTK